MKPITGILRSRFSLGAAIVLLMSLGVSGNALAMYLTDATRPVGLGYLNPDDGMCVVGVAADGTMKIDASITNARDCVAYTTGLTAATSTNVTSRSTCPTAGVAPYDKPCNVAANCSKADGSLIWVAATSTCLDNSACVIAGATDGDAKQHACVVPNDGFRHAWATSNTCVNAANPAVAISLKDLDRTVAMCTSKGGTTLTGPGTCVAYGWVYMNRKSDGLLPVSGVGVFTTDGVQYSDNLGFCYASMRMTSATYTSAATCPSYHNSATGNAAEWPACASSTTGCQTQASYDAGLGWSWDATNSRCLYAYGVTGLTNAAVTQVNGTVTPAATTVDLTTITNQGDCLAAGFAWDNWLPNINRTTKTNADGGYAGLPAGAKIVKLDATTLVVNGGGNFASGTGAVCAKCHTDQSRAYAERQKPGYIETRHKHAGDSTGPWQTNFTAANSDWGIKGVQCNICHSTARAAQDDLIQVVPAGIVGPPAANSPISATGHNKTEYGGHVTDVCFHCHGNFPSGNPGNVVPSNGTDFVLTGKGLAPIGNQFLNSPHAQYTGSSTKADIGNKNLFGSTFVGYLCRSSAGMGNGSIITTMYQNGFAEKIPFLDSLINLDCTNAGNGSLTSGAGGFWVREGDVLNPAPTVPGSPLDSSQGNCMTCHDVHWALASTDPEAEPIRRECTTCHENSGTSASGAPQIDLATINHLPGTGTPIVDPNDPDAACESCHMPKSSATGSYMHLWRISTDPNYVTMGATQANTAADGAYTGAAWIDLDHACGQCHGGGTAQGPGYQPVPPALYRTRATLAGVAKGMHGAAGLNYSVTFSTTINALNVGVNASVDCGGSYDRNDPNAVDPTCPTFTYDWNWGDNTTHGTLDPDSHAYLAAGKYEITLILKTGGQQVGAPVTQGVTLVAPDAPPVAAGACTWDANSWTMTVVDGSTDTPPPHVVVDWGDGGAKSNVVAGGTISKVYTRIGSFTVRLTATDTKGQSDTKTCTGENPATPAYFSIGGTVRTFGGGAVVPGALVTLKKRLPNGTYSAVASTTTSATGTYSFGNLKPARYSITVTKTGFVFPVSTFSTGPSLTVDVNATSPLGVVGPKSEGMDNAN